MKQALRRTLKRVLPPRLREALLTMEAGGPRAIAPAVARYCTGQGLEIGAGRFPYCDRLRTKFLDKNVGNQDATDGADIIADADAIPAAADSFDYVFASHVLEHVQNTIRTLLEWKRVLRPGGHLMVVLPHAERTIDRFRAITTLDHHIKDYATLGDEPDRSHCEEMQAGWLKLPPEELGIETYEQQWRAPVWDWDFRLKHSVLHFHVWTQHEMVQLFEHVGLTICEVREVVPERTDSFMVVGRKPVTEPGLTAS